MRETPWSRLIIFLTCLMKAAQIQAQCGRPNVGENMLITGDTNQQTFLNGSTLTFQCVAGYIPVDSSASRTITCTGPEWTELQLKCTKKSCGPLPELPNGKYTYSDGILFGATAVAQCNKGYLLVGEPTRNCRENGWDGRDPVCEAVKCLPPPTIENGQFEPVEEFYDYNHAVSYSCDKDYTLIGESTITCSNNGTFLPSPPQCSLIKCETPNITNAVRVEGKPPPYGYKNFVRYECNEGYTMNGSGYLVCEVHGWDPSPPTCIPHCGRPNVGENVVMVNDTNLQTFLSGSTLTFQCVTGYTPVDSSASRTITCTGPEWTELRLKCTMIKCETPNITNAVRVEGKPPPYGYKNFVRYECNEGYTMNGSGYLVCEVHGWDPSPPTCILAQIPHPSTTPPPSDGTRVQPSVIITAIAVTIVILLGTNTDANHSD